MYNNHYVSSGAIPTLVAALDGENEVETRFNAAYAIGKLAHDPGMHEVLGCTSIPALLTPLFGAIPALLTPLLGQQVFPWQYQLYSPRSSGN